MIDEQSLILLIENEITRDHGVETMEEAIDFWRQLCQENPLLKQWLERDCSSSSSNDAEQSIQVTHDMLADATLYKVMFAKMLRTIPIQPERFQQLRISFRHEMLIVSQLFSPSIQNPSAYML